jgi:hypothetical protein
MSMMLTLVLVMLLSLKASGFLTHSGSTFHSTACCCFASKSSREIMDTIKMRYGYQADWTKTRNYVYRASDRLSLQQIEHVLSFLDQVFSKDTLLIRSILTSSPRILRKDVTTHLQPTIQFLQKLYGPTMFREAISRNPYLLLSSGFGYGGPNEEMDTFLTEQLGLTANNIKKLKTTAPFLFRLSNQKVKNVVEFLGNILENGNNFNKMQQQRILGKLIMSHPSLMNLSVERNLKPRMKFLVERCELRKSDAATLIKASPGILGLSVEENLRPTLEFLSALLDNDTAMLRKCVVGHSQLLALSLKNLQAKVNYFDAIDGKDSSDMSSSSLSLAGRIAIRSPAVYSLSLKHNIIPTVEFLAQVWGTTSPEVHWHGDTLLTTVSKDATDNKTLSLYLQEFPAILTCSLEGNIQPTLTFFNRTGYTSLTSDWRLNSNNNPIRGRYIAASLFNRLLPRWHHLIANGWPPGDSTPDDPSTRQLLPPLHLLVGATDRAFCEQMGFDFEEYVTFKDQSIPRLKFSSQFDTWLKTGRPIDVH